MTAKENMRKREEEVLATLQDPIRACAEDFLNKYLIPHYKSPTVRVGNREYWQTIIFFECDCPKEYSFDVIEEAVKIADQYGLSAEVCINQNGRKSCRFSKSF